MSRVDEVEEVDQSADSGMGSSDAHSPEVKSLFPDDEDDEEDESLAERLLGLTEMFPEEVRNLGYNVGTCLCNCMKGMYLLIPSIRYQDTNNISFFCRVIRIFMFSSMVILQFISHFICTYIVRNRTSANGGSTTHSTKTGFIRS
ncbi:uncharacterized protein LOC107998224 isoform X1 [Apis cerana]|uniref:uncharacterized protein LOC107998224 isoform X1 n=1 Tax=Apis cerana TaxID=7461 RepID=UPI002B22FEEA|nr:uncharacterized protein LOC107998224 isoform X1 [Apis cerana]